MEKKFKSKLQVTFSNEDTKRYVYDKNDRERVLKALYDQDVVTLKREIRRYYQPFNHHMESLIWECIQNDLCESLGVFLDVHSIHNFETCFDPYKYFQKNIKYVIRNNKNNVFKTLVSKKYYEPSQNDMKIVCRHGATDIFLYLFKEHFKGEFTIEELCTHLKSISSQIIPSAARSLECFEIVLESLNQMEEKVYVSSFKYTIRNVLYQCIVNNSFEYIVRIVRFYIRFLNKKRKRENNKYSIRKIHLRGLLSPCIACDRFEIFKYFLSVITAESQKSDGRFVITSLSMVSNLRYVKYLFSENKANIRKNLVALLQEAILNANIVLVKFILDTACSSSPKASKEEEMVRNLFKFDTKYLKFIKKACEEPELKYNPGNSTFSHFCISEYERTTCREYETYFNKIIRLLLDYDIDLSDYFYLILPYLSKRNDIELIKQLLEHNSSKVSNYIIYNCFYFAIKNDNYELVEYFLCLGFSPDCKMYYYHLDKEKKYECIYFFNELSDIEILKNYIDLKDAEDEYDEINYYNENLLTFAIMECSISIARLLLENGEINPSDNNYMLMVRYSIFPYSQYLTTLLIDNDIMFNSICEWVEHSMEIVLNGLIQYPRDKETRFQTILAYTELFRPICPPVAEGDVVGDATGNCFCLSDDCPHYEPSSNYFIRCGKCNNSMHLLCAYKWLYDKMNRTLNLYYNGQIEHYPVEYEDKSMHFSCPFCRDSIKLIPETERYKIYCTAPLET